MSLLTSIYIKMYLCNYVVISQASLRAVQMGLNSIHSKHHYSKKSRYGSNQMSVDKWIKKLWSIYT